MPDIHTLNIVTHVTLGCLAMLSGLVILGRPKGTAWHRAAGRITLAFAGISLATALAGALVFRGRADLIGVSLLASYHIWSGLRSLRLKARGRRPADLIPAAGLLGLGIGVGLLYASGAGRYHWPASLVYPTVGGLIFYGGWDVLRTLLPLAWRPALNPAEHAVKMTSLTGALVSVACGTVLKSYSVPAALSATALFAGLALVFAIRAARKAVGVTPSAALNARLNTDSEL